MTGDFRSASVIRSRAEPFRLGKRRSLTRGGGIAILVRPILNEPFCKKQADPGAGNPVILNTQGLSAYQVQEDLQNARG